MRCKPIIFWKSAIEYVKSQFYATFPKEKIRKCHSFGLNKEFRQTMSDYFDKFSQHDILEKLSTTSTRTKDMYQLQSNTDIVRIIEYSDKKQQLDVIGPDPSSKNSKSNNSPKKARSLREETEEVLQSINYEIEQRDSHNIERRFEPAQLTTKEKVIRTI